MSALPLYYCISRYSSPVFIPVNSQYFNANVTDKVSKLVLFTLKPNVTSSSVCEHFGPCTFSFEPKH